MEFVALSEEYRADILECVHHGMVCVVDAGGIAACAGDPDWSCFYRSTSKPVQALPIIQRELDRKYGLTAEETAIFSGSHWGDAEHVRVLESILEKTGLREENAIMLPTYPNRPAERERLLRENRPPRKIYHNCFGKHLGMMLLAREFGEEERYWIRDSRTQREILACVSAMSGVAAEEIRVGVDGCGVPVYAVPFQAIATSFLRLVRPELVAEPALREVVRRNMEMLHANPRMLAGQDIICSVLSADPDLIGKSGAKGVYALGIRSLGVGVVGKILDGSQDEFPAVVLRIFELLDYDSDTVRALRRLYPDTIVNDNRETVGYRKAVFTLRKY